jgi:hypothetical protein
MRLKSRIINFVVASAAFLLLEFLGFWADINPRGLFNITFIFKANSVLQNILVLIFYYVLYFFVFALILQFVSRDAENHRIKFKRRFVIVLIIGTALRLAADILLTFRPSVFSGGAANEILTYVIETFFVFSFALYPFKSKVYVKRVHKNSKKRKAYSALSVCRRNHIDYTSYSKNLQVGIAFLAVDSKQ